MSFNSEMGHAGKKNILLRYVGSWSLSAWEGEIGVPCIRLSYFMPKPKCVLKLCGVVVDTIKYNT